MKKLSKKLMIACLSVIMAMSLAGCGKKMECEGCLEEKTCKEYEVSALGMSEDMWLCGDCVDQLENQGIGLEKK
ncbi:MAG: hypothetical protein IJZ96_06315 [Lachnospiraceae bacterium]|nr:hypothetical protein [Lachnospiraceae bacterium]